MKDHQGEFRCIAVDMGAGSIRIMLGVVGNQFISYREVHRFNNQIVQREGYDRWDLARIESGIRNGISMAIGVSKGGITSIGVDCWGADFALLDQKGKLVEDPVAYRDNRTEGMREKWSSMMGELETFRRTGINFYAFNTLFQLLSLEGSEEIKKASKILFLPCYISFLLSGVAANELTISSTSQMLGIDGLEWDPEILGKLQLERENLGRVIEPGTRLGPVILPEAGESGIENVAVCGHDTACVVAALPVGNPNFAYISAGTWCILGIESHTPLFCEEALSLGFTNERGYKHTYRTLKNIVGLWLIQGLKRHLPESATYSDLERMTGEGGEILQLIDPDDPEFYHPADMKEAFNDYFRSTDQPLPEHFSDYLKCAYNSLCFSFRYYIEKLEQLSGRSIEILHVVGGGSQSEILNQRIATICGRKVISGPVEGATLGNILVQAVAMGRIEDLKQGRGLVRDSFTLKTYEPRGESGRIRKLYKKFLNLKEIKSK